MTKRETLILAALEKLLRDWKDYGEVDMKEIDKLVNSRQPLSPIEMLKRCQRQFLEYEKQHLAKVQAPEGGFLSEDDKRTIAKAQVNANFASMIQETLDDVEPDWKAMAIDLQTHMPSILAAGDTIRRLTPDAKEAADIIGKYIRAD